MPLWLVADVLGG